MDGAGVTDDRTLLYRVERFVTQEARLLDDRRFDDWLDLFTPDARYWVPMAWGQESPLDHISLINEDVTLLKLRLRRLVDPRTMSQQPASRTCHQVTNPILDDPAPADGVIGVRSAFTMADYRRDEQRFFAGFVTHHLVDGPDGLRMRLKRVDLLNCDSDHGHLRFGVPF